jgi:hypothetical protein
LALSPPCGFVALSRVYRARAGKAAVMVGRSRSAFDDIPHWTSSSALGSSPGHRHRSGRTGGAPLMSSGVRAGPDRRRQGSGCLGGLGLAVGDAGRLTRRRGRSRRPVRHVAVALVSRWRHGARRRWAERPSTEHKRSLATGAGPGIRTSRLCGRTLPRGD